MRLENLPVCFVIPLTPALTAYLLQMPEEQAFSVLVKIMFDYGLRELFKQNFEDLHCKFYQLERLMQVKRETSLRWTKRTKES